MGTLKPDFLGRGAERESRKGEVRRWGRGQGEEREKRGLRLPGGCAVSSTPPPLKWPPTSAGGGPCAHGAVTEIYSAHSEVSLSLGMTTSSLSEHA